MTTTQSPEAASRVIARSEAPVTTLSGLWVGFPTNRFTALVTLAGTRFEYVFAGHHHNPAAPALGRIRHQGLNSFRATRANGTVTAEDTDRESAIRSLLA
jgi:hypothetical protein